MKQFFAPLVAFVVGMILILASFLFMPAVDTATATLAANTTAIAANYWGWSWLMTAGVTRLLLFVIGFGIIIIDVGIIWLKSKY